LHFPASQMRAAVVVFVLCLAATAHAGGGVFVPPMEVDLGETTTFDGHGESQILAGIHWASLSWKPTPIEIGIGYIGISRDLSTTTVSRSTTGVTISEDSMRLDGGYVTLGKTVANGRYWRSWLLMRGELLHASPGFDAIGGAVRVATELFGSGAAGGGNAGVVGTFAIGFYVEAAYRELPSAYGPAGLSTGITLRVPLIVAN